ncbi:MAG: hypothetical protein IT290_06385 [Deltaproteobacteria bacterium]|nr:hypothetical protein [Deltaproteobacteria bacterium]
MFYVFAWIVAWSTFMLLFGPSVVAIELSSRRHAKRKLIIPLTAALINTLVTVEWEYLGLTAGGLLRVYLLVLIVGFAFSFAESLADISTDRRRGVACAVAHVIGGLISVAIYRA